MGTDAASIGTLDWLSDHAEVASQIFEGAGHWLMEDVAEFPVIISKWIDEVALEADNW